MSLRKKTIRLAYLNPKMRKHLIPILKSDIKQKKAWGYRPSFLERRHKKKDFDQNQMFQYIEKNKESFGAVWGRYPGCIVHVSSDEGEIYEIRVGTPGITLVSVSIIHNNGISGKEIFSTEKDRNLYRAPLKKQLQGAMKSIYRDMDGTLEFWWYR